MNEVVIHGLVSAGKSAAIDILSQILQMLREYDRLGEPRPDILLVTPEIRKNILYSMRGSFSGAVVMDKGRIKEVFNIRVVETVDVEELTPVFLTKYR
jgi:hypothetical protein